MDWARKVATWGVGGLPESFTADMVMISREATPAQLVTESVPLTAGVYLAAHTVSSGSDYFCIGTASATVKLTGVVLQENNPLFIKVNDLYDLWVYSSENGNKISYIAF